MPMLSRLCLLLIVLASPALAQDHQVVVPHSRVFSPPGGTSIEMPTVETIVKVRDQVATTTLRVTLRNPTGSMQEAVCLLPVPQGAAVRRFELEGIGGDEGATLMKREDARRIYQDIVRKMRDPGLLEFAGFGMIRSSVFPVPANGEQVFVLTYEHVLVSDNGRVSYVLPRTESFERLSTAWSYDISIESGSRISTIYSPSHHCAIRRESDHRVHVSVPGSGSNQPGNFMLTYVVEQREGVPSMAFLAYPEKAEDGSLSDDGYYMFLLGLPSAERSESFPPREVTIVLDRSGSMRGDKIEQAKSAAMQVIEALDDGESFNIVDYSDSISMFSERPVVRSAETVAQAREYVRSIRAIGGTNIHAALTKAVGQPGRDGALSIVLFLTDGLPTVGITNEREIRDAVGSSNSGERRVFTFGVGVDVNVPLLSGIAVDSRATSSFVLPDEDVEVKVGKVFRQLHGPILASPRMTVLDASGNPDPSRIRDVQPSALPDLFESDQLVTFGRYLGDEPLRIVLEGDLFGEPKSYEFSFNVKKSSVENVFVPRLWATRQIASLTDRIREHGASGVSDPEDPRVKELIDEVVRLSLEFGILTEYTSFLAVEADDAIALGDRRLRQRVLEEAGAISDRAMSRRSGREAMRRQFEWQAQAERGVMNKRNAVYGDDFEAVESLAICQSQDQTLYNRNGRWVEARVMQKATVEPDETVEFGSDRYFAICDALIDEGRQSVLAFRSEILIDFEGRNVLVTAPN